MRAIRVHRFGDPEVMRLEDVPDLDPGSAQVLVRVHAAGVNPVDTYIRSGTYARKPDLPYTPGMDGAGVVEAVGPEVDHLRPGDRVYLSGAIGGTYTELALCKPSHVHPLPERVAFAEGAALGVPYATAYRALFQRGGALPGETVLVHGATGGVGIAAVQLARAAGLTVIGTGGTEEGRRLAAEQGAHHVLDHHDANHLQRAVELTGGRGMDLIIEMLANVNLGSDLPALAQRGRVVVVGSRGTVEINPRDTMGRDAAILGMSLLVVPDEDLAQVHAALVAGLENGTLNPIVGREMSLADAPEAHRAVMEPGAYGKVVLIP